MDININDIDSLKLILDHVQGLMVIDKNGTLVYMNQRCADYINVNLENSIGRPVQEVFPPTSMPDMLKSSEQSDSDFYFAEGRVSFSSRLQIRSDGEVIGVIEYDLLQELDSLHNFIEKYRHILTDEMMKYGDQLKSLRRTKYSINNLVGSSLAMQQLKQQIMTAAQANSTVLITGETGTGKELVAHSIHNLSNRTFGSFIKVNAAALPEALEESEFFGYEEGAFTGAVRGGKKGKFELADKGTLFIDEISQMPLGLQAKILRTLQEKEIDKIGSDEVMPVDVRVIAATNQELSNLVVSGYFRKDLWYRLNVFPITVPPLRHRKEDIPELVMDKIVQLNMEIGKNIVSVENAVYQRLQDYDWPGNVRELHNEIEKAMHYAQGDTLRSADFNFRIDNTRLNLDTLGELEKPIDQIRNDAERKLIVEILQRYDGNKTKAAQYLKISRPLLYQKMRRLGIHTS
jgi:transcriptional regulator with PAS, ATPase and Fis domain